MLVAGPGFDRKRLACILAAVSQRKPVPFRPREFHVRDHRLGLSATSRPVRPVGYAFMLQQPPFICARLLGVNLKVLGGFTFLLLDREQLLGLLRLRRHRSMCDEFHHLSQLRRARVGEGIGLRHDGDLILLPAAVSLEFGLLGDRPLTTTTSPEHESVGSGALGSQVQRRRRRIVRHRRESTGIARQGSDRAIRACSSSYEGLGGQGSRAVRRRALRRRQRSSMAKPRGYRKWLEALG